MNTENTTTEPKDTLRSFLTEELEDIKSSLGKLKGKLNESDFNSLEGELNERRKLLDSLQDEDDSQLFLLRREVGVLKESVEALSVKQKWWSILPASFWIGIAVFAVLFYFVWLAVLQWRGSNQGLIYDYPATQTAQAAQTELSSQLTATAQGILSSPTEIPVATQTQTP
jgi:hypothetical protein